MSDIEQRHMDEAIPEHCMREANQLACVLSANYLNHRQQIATALAAAEKRGREEERWQPIETAPRDGSYIILGRLDDDGQMEVCGGEWNMHPRRGEDGLNGFNAWLDHPTHWMPVRPPAAIRQPSTGDER